MIINFYNIANIDVVIDKCKLYQHVNNHLEVDIPYGAYKVKIYRNKLLIDTFIINYTCKTNTFNYLYKCQTNFKKFLLTDYYYPNLKIERGLIKLWHTT